MSETYRIWRDGIVREMTPEEIAEFEASRTAGPPPVPQRVTRRQARLALLQAGLLGQVEEMMTAPATPAAVRITYEDATEWWRDDPLVASLGGALGLTAADIDELFRAAAAL